jgi:outer membrane protein insertion porin family
MKVMKYRIPIIAVLLFTAVTVTCFPAALMAKGGPPVNLIELEGLRRVDFDSVMERVSHPIGVPPSPEMVSQDIKAIYGMGYFKDVTAVLEPFEGGLKLVYRVMEKPTVRRVVFHGNESVEQSKLQEALSITSGSLSDTVLIQDNAEALRIVYENEGYPMASVVPVLREISGGYLLLTYYIVEGPRVKVDEIIIEGNEKFSDFEVKKSMLSSEWWALASMGAGGRYSRAFLRADAENIKRFYHDRGYLQADVFEPLVTFSEDRKWMNIVIEVSEGEMFTVSEIAFSGQELYSEEDFRKKLTLKPGDPASRQVLGENATVFSEMYTERGYALASVYPDIVPDPVTRTAKITFRVTEGDIFHMGRIDIKGNVKTMDKVIRREIRVNEGDLFNSKLLRRSYERIVNLNFFEQIKFNPLPNAENKRVGLDVGVSEKSTGFINMGAGYSSIDHFVGMAEVSQSNLGGRGQYIKLKGEFSERSTKYSISFREPWLFNYPVSLNTSLYSQSRRYDEYTKESQGLSLGLSRSFMEYWEVGASYQYERATILRVDNNASDFIKDQQGTRYTGSVTPSISRDSRDNILNPHEGSNNLVYFTYAGIGGTNRYYKIGLDSSWYMPVTKRTTFMARGRYGFASGLEGQELPLYERYHVGNIFTVRGLRDVGPEDEYGNYLGGEQRLIFNFEYIFPLASDIKLNGIVFFDTGTAYDTADEIDWRNTAGTGIRWISPIGPVRLEWARVLRPREGESDNRWEFSIGASF